jgi:phage shock protein B
MDSAFIFVLLILFIVVGLPVTCLTWIVKMRVDGSPRRNKKVDADETKIIQEIYRGLNKMEDRIDTLETILLEQEEIQKKSNSKNE